MEVELVEVLAVVPQLEQDLQPVTEEVPEQVVLEQVEAMEVVLQPDLAELDEEVVPESGVEKVDTR